MPRVSGSLVRRYHDRSLIDYEVSWYMWHCGFVRFEVTADRRSSGNVIESIVLNVELLKAVQN